MLTTTPQKTKLKSTFTFPFFLDAVQAGFPSPAEDKIEKQLKLDKLLISHPASTYFVRVQGNSMQNEDEHNGIFPEDILIIDKALTAKPGDIVIAYINGEFTVKNLAKIDNRYFLMPNNPKYPPIPIFEDTEIWGVVTYIIHKT